MDAVFIFICLGIAYYKSNTGKKYNDMQTKMNPDLVKEANVFQKLFDYLIKKGGI